MSDDLVGRQLENDARSAIAYCDDPNVSDVIRRQSAYIEDLTKSRDGLERVRQINENEMRAMQDRIEALERVVAAADALIAASAKHVGYDGDIYRARAALIAALAQLEKK